MQSKHNIQIRVSGALRRLRRRETRSPTEAGSQKAVAVKVLPFNPAGGAGEAIDAAVVPVLMVRMFVITVPDAAKETVGAAKLQEK
jgi:hypothetical protein